MPSLGASGGADLQRVEWVCATGSPEDTSGGHHLSPVATGRGSASDSAGQSIPVIAKAISVNEHSNSLVLQVGLQPDAAADAGLKHDLRGCTMMVYLQREFT